MIKLSKEIVKRIESEEHYSQDEFIADAKRYIKAVQSGRMLYTVTHVSNSGMSRDINIKSFEGTMTNGSYCTYYSFLKVLGYKFAGNYSSDIKVSGCGINMLFATNYDIIHTLFNMKFVSKKKCEILSQKI